jgi:RimJ/RimL family protein N-acetyltransferase
VITIRRLGPEDAADLAGLRRESLESEPWAFGAAPEDDVHGTVEAFRRSLADRGERAVFGAFETGGSLIGMVGVARLDKTKRRHKAGLWGMYVTARARGQGVGGRLVEQAIRCAHEWPGVEQILLSVTTAAPAARRLYEKAGFRQWGREPRGILWKGKAEDELHFLLDLHP